MNLAHYKAKIELGLTMYLDKQIKTAPSNEAILLLTRLKKVIKTGGKRFRPSLFFLTYKAYGGDAECISIGLGLELFHQGLLIHDDLIDEDLLRHGKPNIIGLYKKDNSLTNEAYAMGLLAGDLLLTLVSGVILEGKDLSAKNKLHVLGLFQKTTNDVIFGQQLDLLNHGNHTKKHILKTAKYTTVLPMVIAASLLNIKKLEIKKINNYAEVFGMYYQLVNDFNDYFKKDHGVYKLKDFKSGKLTYPYILAHELVNSRKLMYLKKHFSKNLSLNQELKVLDILHNAGVEQASRDFLQKYHAKSISLLNKLEIKDKSQLLALTESIKV